jgi:hypothetical protein
VTAVTSEQIQRAKQVDILAYLSAHEPKSLRKSKGSPNEYYLAEHDSLKISNGRFHWFSRGVGGYSALDFLVKVRGMGFVDAVRHLTDGIAAAHEAEYPAPMPAPERHFSLPPKNANNDRVYAYLRGRGIDSGTVKQCFDAGTLYENTKGNCIFVGYDGNKPRFACERGTKDGCKKDLPGSDKAFSFVLPPANPDSRNLICFESPIDSISHAAIHKMDGGKWDGYRLSLGGVGSAALTGFLERNPQIDSIRLCLDRDKAGIGATNRIIRELLSDQRYSHLKISVAPPPAGKDYSDTLKAVIQLNRQKTRPDRSNEAVNFI